MTASPPSETSARPSKTLRILGTRGVPAAHGGFETFAEHLALFLVQKGWRVVVYCQLDGHGALHEDRWQGVERVNIPVARGGPAGTIEFDWLATRHAARHRDTCLVLGYNTAVFCAWLRMRGVRCVINMDGIEWSRAKWGRMAKAWFWLNDWAGCWLGDQLVADHPEIARHLASRVRADKITTIAYGADPVHGADEAPVRALGLVPGRYLTLVARPEPENSILEVVQGFSAHPRGHTLAVLGHYDPQHPYHQAVMAAAGPEVRFLGAIYDKPVVQALRFHGLAYVHGHQVGGTNPSLVEALAVGNAVIAHDNRFNRWVCAPSAVFFKTAEDFSGALGELLAHPDRLRQMAADSRSRFEQAFRWETILGAYAALLGSP